MTNHAIIALERVRDELSDDWRGLPRVTRSYQRPAPRSVTPHHSRGHARLLKARSHPAKSSQRNWRKQNQNSLRTPFPKAGNTVYGHHNKVQAASSNLRRGSDRAAARATRTRAAVLQSCGGKSSSGHWQWPAAQPPLRQLLRPRSRVLTQVHFSPPAPPRVSRRVQPQPTEIWRAIAGDGKGESACRVCAERERKKGDRTRVLRRQHSASERCLCRPA